MPLYLIVEHLYDASYIDASLVLEDFFSRFGILHIT